MLAGRTQHLQPRDLPMRHALNLALALAIGLASACNPEASAAPRRGPRPKSYARQGRARVVITSALPAYTAAGSGLSRTITANANGALASQDGVSLAVGDQILLTAGAAGADNGL